MVNLCNQNPLDCRNNGQCSVIFTSNTTFCQCDSCHEGSLCENPIGKQTEFDDTYVYLVIFIIGLCLSMLNNGLSLELFVGCKRIRRTNCGIYLIIYSILSMISSILLVADNAVQYYPNQLIKNKNQYDVFHCYVTRIGYNTLVYICIWHSAFVAFERGVIIRFGNRMNSARWRLFGAVIFVVAVVVGFVTPMLVYNCDWDHLPHLFTLRNFSIYFYFIVGITIYILATLLVLYSFTRYIREYGMENGSFIKTFLKLLYKHLFFFVPPIAYVVCYIPYPIVYSTGASNPSYLQCGTSTGEFIIKVLAETLQGVPNVITWLLFVYPSKVYMTEYYINTWSGQRLAGILDLLTSR